MSNFKAMASETVISIRSDQGFPKPCDRCQEDIDVLDPCYEDPVQDRVFCETCYEAVKIEPEERQTRWIYTDPVSDIEQLWRNMEAKSA